MQWSKLKQQVESRFAPSVVGRVELRITNYRHVHDGEGRGWITLDKREVHNFCTLKYYVEHQKLADGIRAANNATSFRDPAQQSAYYEAYDQADTILAQRGVLSQHWFERSLEAYLSITINAALASENFLHRGLAVVDRRLGKRRLQALALPPTEHPLVARLLQFRLAAEGLPLTNKASAA